MVEFTEKEFDSILEYQKKIKADTIQDAILIAIRIARSKEDFNKFANATMLASATWFCCITSGDGIGRRATGRQPPSER